jgi:hypothetical protein
MPLILLTRSSDSAIESLLLIWVSFVFSQAIISAARVVAAVGLLARG